MFNNTMVKTVDILSGLTQKIINIKFKADQNSLLDAQYQELDNRIKKLLNGFNNQEEDEDSGEIMLVVSGLESILGAGTINTSNGTWMNGEYYLIDKTATGTARVWKHKDYESVIKVAGSPIQYWAICPTNTSTSFEIFISNNGSNVLTDSPYDENTLSSLVWNYRGSYASSVSVAAQIVSNDSSGDSGDNEGTDCYIVVGAGSSEYNGVYTYLDESNGYPRYSCLGANGSTMMYIQYNTTLFAYTICDSMGNTMAYVCAGTGQDIGGKWGVGTASDPAPTVTKSRAEWSITGAGTTAVNGTYALIDDTTENNEIWSNGTYKLSKMYINVLGEATTYYIYPISGGLLPSAANHTYYGYKSGGNYNPNEVVWSVGTGSMTGIAPIPTFTPIYENGSGDSDDDSENIGNTDSYIVSNCGLLYFNGEYAYAGEYNGKPYYTRIYKPSAASELSYTYYLSYRSDTSGWGITDQLEGSITPYYYQSTVSETPDGGVYAVVSGKGSSPAPSVTKGENSGGDSGETSDYIVTNAADTKANGDYYLTDEIGFDSTPVYKNANGYSIRWSPSIGWYIADNTGMDVYTSGNLISTDVPTGNWGSVTVTKDGGNTTGKAFKVTFSGTHEAAGIYRESGTYNSFPAYKHESLEYYIWTMQTTPGMYAHYLGKSLGSASAPLWMLSNSSADNVAGSWGQATATVPGPTVTEYTE